MEEEMSVLSLNTALKSSSEVRAHFAFSMCPEHYRIIEPFWLKETLRIIKSNPNLTLALNYVSKNLVQPMARDWIQYSTPATFEAE